MIKHESNEGELRDPNPDVDDIKIIHQMQNKIVFKSYINVMVSMAPSKNFKMKINGDDGEEIELKELRIQV